MMNPLRPTRDRFLFVLAVVSALLVSVLPGAAADEPSAERLEQRILSFRESFERAAVSTRTGELTALRDEMIATSAIHVGQINGFSEINLLSVADVEDWRKRPVLGWEYRGVSVAPAGCGVAGQEQCAAISMERIRAMLPKGDMAHMVIVRNKHLLVYALTQDQGLVDSLRVGQQVRLVVRPQGMFDETVVAVLQSAEVQDGHLECENGHQFPADSSYRFCPDCGRPLSATR